MSFKLMQLPCEEDTDFFGDENLQVYARYCSDPKADRGGFMHRKISSIPPVNPVVIAMISILPCQLHHILPPGCCKPIMVLLFVA
ncbi:unnamed protein product [Sphagnum jensenii]|uniref:Uncharacterized protein n=1 Tax=Sphagnum jensenii TaxID=128206 RepID=A0ABP0XKF5_9BRYO